MRFLLQQRIIFVGRPINDMVRRCGTARRRLRLAAARGARSPTRARRR